MSFTAQYTDLCKKCDDIITPGQEVQYGAFDELVHSTCPSPDTEVTTGLCPVCFLVLPVNGVCGVCE